MIYLPVGGFNPLMYHPSPSVEINVFISNASYDLPVPFFFGGGGLTLWSTIFFWYLFVGVFPFFVCCSLLFIVFVFSLFLVFFFSVVFPLLFFWLCCFLCLSLWSKRRTNKEKRATTKGRNKDGQEKGRERKPPKTKEDFGKRLFVLFLFCCLSETSSPKRCKNTEKTRFSLVLSHSLKNQAPYKKQIKTKEQIRGATLWSTILGEFLCWCVSLFCFFVVYCLFIVFVFSLFFFFFFFNVVFPLLFFGVMLLSVSFSLKQKKDK